MFAKRRSGSISGLETAPARAGSPLQPCLVTVSGSEVVAAVSHCCFAVAQSCPTLCDPMACSTPGPPSFTVSQSLFRFMSLELVMPSNRLILRCPLLLLPSILPSIRVFSSESGLHIRWSKYQSFSFSISPSNEYSGLISFRMDWLDLLAVQGTLKSLLQHHSSRASILQH